MDLVLGCPFFRAARSLSTDPAPTRELIWPVGDESRSHSASSPNAGSHLAADTAAAYDPDWDRSYPQYQPVGKVLKPCPT